MYCGAYLGTLPKTVKHFKTEVMSIFENKAQRVPTLKEMREWWGDKIFPMSLSQECGVFLLPSYHPHKLLIIVITKENIMFKLMKGVVFDG